MASLSRQRLPVWRRLRPILGKTWIETQTHFLIGLAAITVVCLALLLGQGVLRNRLSGRLVAADRVAVSLTYAEYVHRFVNAGAVQPLSQMIVVILAVGGLQRERENGTAALTLSLPLTRSELVGARAAIGLTQVVLLAGMPGVLTTVVAPAVGEVYPISQAIGFWILAAATQALIFCATLLVSALGTNQLTSLLVAWLLLWGHSGVALLPALRPYSVSLRWIATGMGMPYVDPATSLLIALPWLRLAVLASLSAALIVATARVTTRQDY